MVASLPLLLNPANPVVIIDATGAPITEANPLFFAGAGSLDTNIAAIAALIDVSSGALKVTPRDADGSSVQFENESPVGSATAHDAVDAGNPVKIGGIARAGLSGATLVAAADRTNNNHSLDGKAYVCQVPLEDAVDGNASNTDGTVTTVIAASGDAAIKTYLTKASLSNSSAAGVMFDILSGAVVKWSVWVPALGGREIEWPMPGLKPNAANETWRFDPGAATTTAYCAAAGYKSKV